MPSRLAGPAAAALGLLALGSAALADGGLPQDPAELGDPPEDWMATETNEPGAADEQPGDLVDRPWQLPPLRFTHPRIFEAHTAQILPAAAVYVGAGLDTGGNAGAIAAFGLGNVADFSASVTDLIRARDSSTTGAETVAPYFTATLRLGLDEGRFFSHQPAIAVGFRKSFEHEIDGFRTRVAELVVVASKSLGPVAMHVGASLWDAEILRLHQVGLEEETPAFLHDRGLSAQLRASAGVAVNATPSSQIMLETLSVPELNYEEPRVSLVARFAFGVRYALGESVVLESGVSVPDIEARDLSEAQIFGRLRFTTHHLARPYQEAE
jgi:hypothetical protein